MRSVRSLLGLCESVHKPPFAMALTGLRTSSRPAIGDLKPNPEMAKLISLWPRERSPFLSDCQTQLQTSRFRPSSLARCNMCILCYRAAGFPCDWQASKNARFLAACYAKIPDRGEINGLIFSSASAPFLFIPPAWPHSCEGPLNFPLSVLALPLGPLRLFVPFTTLHNGPVRIWLAGRRQGLASSNGNARGCCRFRPFRRQAS